MVFERKWSDEQNKEIGEKFGISASNVSKRVSYLRKLDKKSVKKKKSAKKPKEKSSEKIEVMTAPSHDNAEELMKEYQVEPINTEKVEGEVEVENKKEAKEKSEVGQVNWTGVSSTITTILDKRFVANDLAPLSEEEKALFADALNQTLEIRAKFYFQYADVVNLGLAGFAILTPRILEFLERKDKAKREVETAANLDLTEAVKEEAVVEVVDDQIEATRRYQEMMAKQ